MRNESYYAKLYPEYFTGRTGMRLQARGTPGLYAMFLGGFLTANRYTNLIGLYELPPERITRLLPVLQGADLAVAFSLLSDEGFAYYDARAEVVWVHEMARIRLDLHPGVVLTNRRRLTAAQNLYRRAPANVYLGPFFDRYHIELGLSTRRSHYADEPALTSPEHTIERSGEHTLEHSSERFSPEILQSPQRMYVQYVQQANRQQTTEELRLRRSDSELTQQQPSTLQAEQGEPLPPGPQKDPDPEGLYAVITALVTKDILPQRLPDETLYAATVAACRRHGITWTADTVRKAIDSALFRYYRAQRLEHDLPADPRGLYHDHIRKAR